DSRMREILLFLCLLSLAGSKSARGEVQTPLEVDANNTAYLAFRINDEKIVERVKRLDEAALNVSKDFAPFLVDPMMLYQPIISIYLEEDEVKRAKEIYDRQLQMMLCGQLPRRIPYTQFKLIDQSMQAISQTDNWIKVVKVYILEALNRHGLISLGNLGNNMILIVNPRGMKQSLDEIDLRPLKLTASSYIDRFFICRGPAPTPEIAYPCEIIAEFPLIKCPFRSI
ncbi:hypothetical protein PMAYCL1PPCAC_13153, partial [Pristionchus mayeri]